MLLSESVRGLFPIRVVGKIDGAVKNRIERIVDIFLRYLLENRELASLVLSTFGEFNIYVPVTIFPMLVVPSDLADIIEREELYDYNDLASHVLECLRRGQPWFALDLKTQKFIIPVGKVVDHCLYGAVLDREFRREVKKVLSQLLNIDENKLIINYFLRSEDLLYRYSPYLYALEFNNILIPLFYVVTWLSNKEPERNSVIIVEKLSNVPSIDTLLRIVEEKSSEVLSKCRNILRSIILTDYMIDILRMLLKVLSNLGLEKNLINLSMTVTASENARPIINVEKLSLFIRPQIFVEVSKTGEAMRNIFSRGDVKGWNVFGNDMISLKVGNLEMLNNETVRKLIDIFNFMIRSLRLKRLGSSYTYLEEEY